MRKMHRRGARRWLALAMTCLLSLWSCTALAAPRYPAQTGDAADAALLLSAQTLADWKQLAEKVRDATGVRLYLATVDFLDGETLADYGQGLRERWDLGKKDLLLLMAAGEDRFGFFGGEKVNERFSPAAQEKLLSTAFQAEFLAQSYDAALASLGPALARELGKCYGETIRTAGLFGQSESAGVLTTQDWIERQIVRRESEKPQESLSERMVQEDHNSGMSFGKVFLTVVLLLMIFGGSRRQRRGGCGCSGCGCMPFSSLLGWLGLWKLWGDDD